MYKLEVPRIERMATIITNGNDLTKGTVLSFNATAGGYVPADISNNKLPHAVLLEDVAGSNTPVKAKVLLKGIIFTDEFNITNPAVVAYLDMVGIHVFTREEITTL